jgi:prepilin-type N-terminal cleavage/methylation domain-containing protein
VDKRRTAKKGGENMMKRMRKGFTLIELLVVIGIIALLSTLAVVALNNAREKSRDAKRVADVKQIQTALELYFQDQNAYPVEAVAINLGESPNDVLDAGGFVDAAATAPTYMGQVPDNQGPGGSNYVYTAAAPGSTYSIVFDLEGNTGNLQDGADADAIPTCTATPSGITCV